MHYDVIITNNQNTLYGLDGRHDNLFLFFKTVFRDFCEKVLHDNGTEHSVYNSTHS